VKKRRTGLLIAALVGIPILALILAGIVYSVLEQQQRESTSAQLPALSTLPMETAFEFAPWLPGGGSASFQLLVDGRSAGVLSNTGAGGRVTFGPLAPGLHTFRLDGLTIYDAGGAPVSANGWCQNQLFAFPGKTSYSVVLSIDFSGGTPRPNCWIQ